VPTVRAAGFAASAFVGALDHALGRVLAPLANLIPRRLRRAAERIERRQTMPLGQYAAAGFLLASISYGLTIGGQAGRVADALLVLAGFGIDDVRISGYKETAELAVLEKLEIGGSLVSYHVKNAQSRVADLPWVQSVTIRKFYPSSLAVEISERTPFALWQRGGEVYLIDRSGTEIVPLKESRFAKLPFMVGGGANATAASLLTHLMEEPSVAEQMRAAVLVAERRWDLHLENGVTVKLPEKNVRRALATLVKLDAERQLLARDVVIVDLRLPDRVTVRLPEGRSLEDVTSESAASGKEKARI
jgi:cell division protein FtsQ